MSGNIFRRVIGFAFGRESNPQDALVLKEYDVQHQFPEVDVEHLARLKPSGDQVAAEDSGALASEPFFQPTYEDFSATDSDPVSEESLDLDLRKGPVFLGTLGEEIPALIAILQDFEQRRARTDHESEWDEALAIKLFEIRQLLAGKVSTRFSDEQIAVLATLEHKAAYEKDRAERYCSKNEANEAFIEKLKDLIETMPPIPDEDPVESRDIQSHLSILRKARAIHEARYGKTLPGGL